MENIPKKFEMSDGISLWLVECQKDGTYARLNKTYNTSGSGYNEVNVRKWIGTYEITKIYEEEKPVANGVDAEGKALNFTPDMLKPFMRVVTSVRDYIVTNPYPDGTPCMHSGSGHIRWEEPDQCDEYSIPYVVDEVYEAPASYYGLDVAKRGKLIWKRQEVKPVDDSINKRLEWLQVHIDAVKENMESLQAEYDELKQAVK